MSTETDDHCILANVKVDKQLFNGDCTINQIITKDHTIWQINMGSAEPLLFAGNGTDYKHGPEKKNSRTMATLVS